MNHTKEPWGYGGFYNQIHTEKPVIQDGGSGCAVAYELYSGGEGRVVAIFKKKQDLDFVLELFGACANLPEPEKNIRELVVAARKWVGLEEGNEEAYEALCKALAPFEEKK